LMSKETFILIELYATKKHELHVELERTGHEPQPSFLVSRISAAATPNKTRPLALRSHAGGPASHDFASSSRTRCVKFSFEIYVSFLILVGQHGQELQLQDPPPPKTSPIQLPATIKGPFSCTGIN
jgi:hypothetical protein